MSKKNKLKRFADIGEFSNVYENFNPLDPKLVHIDGQRAEMMGVWGKDHFKNDNPITLELACGGGEYTIALAQQFPDRNFIGVDVKGARIWKGASKAINQSLDNVAFLRTRIEQIHLFVGENEVDQIWITFPDPFLRDSKENRRLTSTQFLDHYKSILNPNGLIHLKTDSTPFYDFTLEMIGARDDIEIEYQCDDIYAGTLENPVLEIKTHYEAKHLLDNRLIKYVRFRFV